MPYVCCSPLWFKPIVIWSSLLRCIHTPREMRKYAHTSSSWNSISFAIVSSNKKWLVCISKSFTADQCKNVRTRSAEHARYNQSVKKQPFGMHNAYSFAVSLTERKFVWSTTKRKSEKNKWIKSVICRAENEKRWKNKSLHQSTVYPSGETTATQLYIIRNNSNSRNF